MQPFDFAQDMPFDSAQDMPFSIARDHAADRRRPIAYVSMQDPRARAGIADLLEGAGWTVRLEPTGFHLLHAIAGVIDGNQPWLRPDLIVVDARSRGCAGTTIAAGLRDLGITIPIVVVAGPGEALPISPDRTLRIVDRASVTAAVAELAGPAHAAPIIDQPAA